MKELVGIILLTVLVVFGSCNSNTNVSLVETSPQLFDVCQVSTGNPDYRNKELFMQRENASCSLNIAPKWGDSLFELFCCHLGETKPLLA